MWMEVGGVARRVEGGAPAGEGGAQARRQLAAHRRGEKVADDEAPAMRGDDEPVRLVGALFEHDSQPERLKPPNPALAIDVDPLDGEIVAGKADDLAPAGAPIAEAEGEGERRDVEAEEP